MIGASATSRVAGAKWEKGRKEHIEDRQAKRKGWGCRKESAFNVHCRVNEQNGASEK